MEISEGRSGNEDGLFDDGGVNWRGARCRGGGDSTAGGDQESGNRRFCIGRQTSSGRDDARVRVASGMSLRSVHIALQSSGPMGNLLSGESFDHDHRAATKRTQPGGDRLNR